MNWTFLVVDDNEQELAGMAALLKRVQPMSQVWTAKSGQDALDLLEERRTVPSLILLDYAMPGMSGVEFLAEVRNVRWLDRVPIVMVSEPIDDRLIMTCYRFGAISYFAKPVHQFELRQALRDFARPARRMASGTSLPGGDAARRSAA